MPARAPAPAPYKFRVLGIPRAPFRDLYHAVLRWPWSLTLGFFAVVFFAANAGFALLFLGVGGVHNLAQGSLWDAFFFSLQTMATIGYGYMYPEGHAAHLVVAIEAFFGLIYTAMATGIIFAKFSRSRARVVWTSRAVIAPFDGGPSLMIRLGNERGNSIVGANIRMLMSRTEIQPDGRTFYRNLDLKLVRDNLMSLARAWTAIHLIDESSPLHGVSPEMAEKLELEIFASVIGLDDTTMQAVHSQMRYYTKDIVWGARFADILSEDAHGDIVVDLSHFDELEPTPRSESFPHGRT